MTAQELVNEIPNLAKALHHSGLSLNSAYILMRGEFQGCTGSLIHKETGLTEASVTHAIDALEARGLARRAASIEDRRIKWIVTTTKGTNELRKIRDRIKAAKDSWAEANARPRSGAETETGPSDHRTAFGQ